MTDKPQLDHDHNGKAGGSLPKAKRSQAEINAELRARAARQAAKAQVSAAEDPIVTCRVLKNGDGRISTGVHAAGIGEVHYERNEKFTAPRSVATVLEDRGFIEIQ